MSSNALGRIFTSTCRLISLDFLKDFPRRVSMDILLAVVFTASSLISRVVPFSVFIEWGICISGREKPNNLFYFHVTF